jgi:polyisoprenoid-binding protein YceI
MPFWPLVSLLCVLLPGAGVARTTLQAGADDEPTTWRVDSLHSTAIFRVRHLDVAYAYGRFNEVDGSIVFDEGAPEESSVVLEIKTDTVDTNSEDRDNHLRGEMFFDVENHPLITFESTSVATTDEADHYLITGELTFRGVTKTVTVPVEHVGTGPDPWGGQRSGFELQFDVDALEYEIPYATRMKALGKDIRIIVSIESIRES